MAQAISPAVNALCTLHFALFTLHFALSCGFAAPHITETIFMPVPDSSPFATVAELGRRLWSREFTSVELTRFFLDRLERLGPKLNAVVTVTRERALAEAQQADAELCSGRYRGPLHGIPYGAKDLLATKGIPTTWGAAPFKEQMFDEDAAVITKLREAGAVLAAKLAMVEIAGGLGYRQANATFTGPGLNPWNLKRWAGGSSSGSGAAVAAGLIPFSIGTETWGSIMTPAGNCGVTGLRPTYDLIDRKGAMALTWTMDKIGPLARTAQDCGLILNAVQESSAQSRAAPPRELSLPHRSPQRCSHESAAGGQSELRGVAESPRTLRDTPRVQAAGLALRFGQLADHRVRDGRRV